MSRHTKLFGSTSYRTLQCPAHYQLGKDIPEPPQSEAAAEGSMLHALCEDILKGRISDKSKRYQELNDDQKNIVDTYVGLVRELLKGAYWRSYELQVNLPNLHPEWFGTADAVIFKGNRLIIVDLKCGRIPVEAFEYGRPDRPNPQIGFYAISVLLAVPPVLTASVTEIELIIVQPREGGVKRMLVTRKDLEELQERLLVAAEEAEGDDPTAVVGPACHFCKVKPVCPKFAEHVYTQAQLDFASENDGEASQLTPLEIEAVLPHAKLAIKWGNAVIAEAERRLDMGEKIPGWQLVPKKAIRDWKNPRDAARHLIVNGLSSDVIYPQKLVSPAQAEALAKQKNLTIDLTDFVQNASNGLKLGKSDEKDDGDDAGWNDI